MLDCRMKGKYRLCLYKGEEMTASELSELDECVVPLSVLTQRISQGMNSSSRTRWDSVDKCLTSKIIKGCPKINRTVKRPYEPSYFIKLMMMMPVNSYRTRIIQGKRLDYF